MYVEKDRPDFDQAGVRAAIADFLDGESDENIRALFMIIDGRSDEEVLAACPNVSGMTEQCFPWYQSRRDLMRMAIHKRCSKPFSLEDTGIVFRSTGCFHDGNIPCEKN